MAKGMKIHLLIIDPQNDFMEGGSLAVPGARADMQRLAKMIDRVGHRLEDIHVTLDSHRLFDIAHPVFWKDQNGKAPAPFTLISASDIKANIWSPRILSHRPRALTYAETLEANSQYKICIWPPHCLIGTPGHNVQEDLNASLQTWCEKYVAMIDYVTKGSNPFTEHYGAFAAEVPDPTDTTTLFNFDLLNHFKNADMVGVAGEASSHCVFTTVNQIAEKIGDEHIKKFHLLTDCMSSVPAIPNVIDFPAITETRFEQFEKSGMTRTNSVDFLS
jgi:nicotinamidase/pyrazinamidase